MFFSNALADCTTAVHTPTMTLKNAALLALVGTNLLTILLLAHLIIDILAVAGGVVPALRLVASLIYALASVSLAVFFWVFFRAQG